MLVLVVDDDADCASEMAELLQSYDCRTILAVSAQAALAAARDGRPDVALIDVHLGEESGLDLARSLKGVTPRIVLHSGRPLSQRESASLADQQMAFLLKPIVMEELFAAMGGSPRPVVRGKEKPEA